MKRISIILFGLLLSAFLLESGFLVYTVLFPNRERHMTLPAFYYAPGQKGSFVNYPYSPTRQKGVFRIATIGDSFTFPHAMHFDDCYSKRLERMLNLNGSQKAEVINYGVAGYSTRDEIKLVKRAVREEANLIILEITLNDPEFEPVSTLIKRYPNKYTFGPFQRKEHPLIKYSQLLTFIAARIHNWRSWESYIRYHRDLFAGKTWDSFAYSVKKICAITAKNKTQLAALIFPLFAFPFDRSYPMKQVHEKIHALLRKNSIRYLDLLPVYRGMPHERLAIDPRRDRHPNELAHRMAADYLYLWLEANDFIPANLKITRKYALRPSHRVAKPLGHRALRHLLRRIS